MDGKSQGGKTDRGDRMTGLDERGSTQRPPKVGVFSGISSPTFRRHLLCTAPCGIPPPKVGVIPGISSPTSCGAGAEQRQGQSGAVARAGARTGTGQGQEQGQEPEQETWQGQSRNHGSNGAGAGTDKAMRTKWVGTQGKHGGQSHHAATYNTIPVAG